MAQMTFQMYMPSTDFIFGGQNGLCLQTRRKRHDCFFKFCVFLLGFSTLLIFVIIDAISGDYRAFGFASLFLFILLLTYMYRWRWAVKDDREFTTCILRTTADGPRYSSMTELHNEEGVDLPIASGSGFCIRSSQDERVLGSSPDCETRLSMCPVYKSQSDLQFNRELAFDNLVDQA